MGKIQPRDDGLIGPDAVAWRVIGHPGALIGGLRSLILQSLHPLAMAGVAQHSDYARRPLDRLHRTTYYVAATAYGDTETALAAAERVRRRHGKVRGVDPVTGREYSADDPETQIWVHATEWHSFLVGYRTFGPGLSAEEEDQYFWEGSIIGSQLGCPASLIPSTAAEMSAYFRRVRPELRISDDAREAIQFVVNPRPTRETLPYFGALAVYGNAARALVPRDLRRLAEIDRSPALDLPAIAAARPLLLASRMPGLRELAARVVGHETIALIDSRLRPDHGATRDADGPLSRAA
jgi:uncharacterized protein (DUF2236 family)